MYDNSQAWPTSLMTALWSLDKATAGKFGAQAKKSAANAEIFLGDQSTRLGRLPKHAWQNKPQSRKTSCGKTSLAGCARLGQIRCQCLHP